MGPTTDDVDESLRGGSNVGETVRAARDDE